MSKTFVTCIACGCLLAGALAGLAGAQVLDTWQQRFLNSGPFSVAPGQTASFRVALDEQPGGLPARVLLQLLDENGKVVTESDVTLQPGQWATLHGREPGVFRAHARVVESATGLTGRRTVVGTIEVSDTLTTRPVCNVDTSIDPTPVPSRP